MLFDIIEKTHLHIYSCTHFFTIKQLFVFIKVKYTIF